MGTQHSTAADVASKVAKGTRASKLGILVDRSEGIAG